MCCLATETLSIKAISFSATRNPEHIDQLSVHAAAVTDQARGVGHSGHAGRYPSLWNRLERRYVRLHTQAIWGQPGKLFRVWDNIADGSQRGLNYNEFCLSGSGRLDEYSILLVRGILCRTV